MKDETFEGGDLALRFDLEEAPSVEVMVEVEEQVVEVKVEELLEEDVAFLHPEENPEEVSPRTDAEEIFPDHALRIVPEDHHRLFAEEPGAAVVIDLAPQLIDLPDNETDHTRAPPHLAQVQATLLLLAPDPPLVLRDLLDHLPTPQDLGALEGEEEDQKTTDDEWLIVQPECQ
jgi:hypothetical protein